MNRLKLLCTNNSFNNIHAGRGHTKPQMNNPWHIYLRIPQLTQTRRDPQRLRRPARPRKTSRHPWRPSKTIREIPRDQARQLNTSRDPWRPRKTTGDQHRPLETTQLAPD